MDNKCIQKDKKELKKFVYSIRIDARMRKVLKDNPEIKRDLDKFIIQYLNSFL
jgi:hypothetical protein